MNIQFYELQTLSLLGELRISNITFDIREQQFLLSAGYSRTPVQVTALPVAQDLDSREFAPGNKGRVRGIHREMS